MKLRSFKVIFGFIIATCVGTGIVMAQGDSITFKASQLQKIAQDYTGSPVNWPLVVSLADHNTESNEFTITPSQIQELENFSQVYSNVAQQRKRIGELISSGATIFASDEYRQVQQLLTAYTKAINDGEMEQAFTLGSSIPPAVDDMEVALNTNRVVDVQAQLTEKRGLVDKRTGLLGSWSDAMQGDLFEQSDGIRTFTESYALLSFVDGSDIQVEPNTIAVIRKSRIDQLNDAADTEITLEDGGLLAKLSAAGKDRGRYVLNAGSSISELQTLNFYAETEESGLVKLTNYDGQAIVNSNNVSITIRKNEGTIVERDKAPMAPVKLLPSPEITWASTDTIINDQTLIYSYHAIEGAQHYRIQYGKDQNFKDDVKELITEKTSIPLNDLPMGMTYFRVQATDNLGLRGPFSKTAQILRTEDNVAPPIFIDGLKEDLIFTTDNRLTLKGVTEPEARLIINDEQVKVQPTGRFTHTITGIVGKTNLSLSATDISGNTTQMSLSAVNLSENRVFDFNVRSASGNNLSALRSGTATFSGSLYPGIKVVLTNNGTTRTIDTDFNGNWATTFNLVSGDLTIEFRSADTGILYFSNSYRVE